VTPKYCIGVDFGTESGRAVLVDVSNGAEIATAVHPYKHGVIDEYLPDSTVRLEPDWALQDPQDYLDVLKTAIPAVLKHSGVDPAAVIGLGVDFTANTFLPTLRDGTPLCFLPQYRQRPHAWVKLWKHHAAQPEANRITQIAKENDFNFLDRYGGKVSSEWFFPKVWQILKEDPEIYDAAERFPEAGDWIVWQMTGLETRNACAAGYKAFWSGRDGFPPDEFFERLDPRLEHIVDEKMSREILPLGARAGLLTEQAAAWTGLRAGIAVAAAIVDAHVSVPAASVIEPGTLVAILGTSNCLMILGQEEKQVPGICGYTQDGIVPGYFGYEAGQSCVGDLFAWQVENCVPAAYQTEASQRGLDIHALLEQKAAALKPGESGLLALDWWNGNRTILVDIDLTGLILGMTLRTRAEEIYRALIEATAFGTRLIIENFNQHGIPIHAFVATGGLPDRNRLLMQIYADVTGLEIRVSAAKQASALGAAMFGAVAAGQAAGGYASIQAASQRMAHLREEVYRPILAHQQIYDQLYQEYLVLHDTFGRGPNDVMKRLKSLKAEVIHAI
jgi:L-ribulokinase